MSMDLFCSAALSRKYPICIGGGAAQWNGGLRRRRGPDGRPGTHWVTPAISATRAAITVRE